MSTIIALSTPPARSAIAVVRMSGSKTLDICSKVFFPVAKIKPRQACLGTAVAGKVRDKALMIQFPAPKSYTGEDMAEFYLHGSMAVVRAFIAGCIGHGATAAEPGEFTKRAFLSGKIDLSEAEGIIDLIDSVTETQARAAYAQAEGRLSKSIAKLQSTLTDALAAVEVDIDYPEEDLGGATARQTEKSAQEVKAEAAQLIATYSYGRIIREGVKIAICGAANAGKSSLLNALLGQDRAIVTDIAGTTRDTLTESYEYKGMQFCITDTAGFNDNAGEIERLGINRSVNAAKAADIILFLSDSSEKPPKELAGLEAKTITVATKADIVKATGDIKISVKTGENIEALKELIYERTAAAEISLEDTVITSSRHFDALTEAESCLSAAIDAIRQGKEADIFAEDLRQAWLALGRITGVTGSEEVVHAIFKRFCVGK